MLSKAILSQNCNYKDREEGRSWVHYTRLLRVGLFIGHRLVHCYRFLISASYSELKIINGCFLKCIMATKVSWRSSCWRPSICVLCSARFFLFSFRGLGSKKTPADCVARDWLKSQAPKLESHKPEFLVSFFLWVDKAFKYSGFFVFLSFFLKKKKNPKQNTFVLFIAVCWIFPEMFTLKPSGKRGGH